MGSEALAQRRRPVQRRPSGSPSNTPRRCREDEGVDDDLAARVRAQFDEKALIELTALIAFQNLSARFNAALAIAPQGLCRVPPR